MFVASSLHIFLLLHITYSIGGFSYPHMESFVDFLDYYHLNHGIVVMCNDIRMNQLKTIPKGNYWFSYYTVGQGNSSTGNIALKELKIYGSVKTGVFLHVECQTRSRHLLEAASANNFFNLSLAWFVVANSTTVAMEALSGLDINIDTDITLAIRVPRTSDVLWLFDVYGLGLHSGSGLQMATKGNWSAGGGFQLLSYYRSSIVQRRRNFTGIILSGGVVITDAPRDVSMTKYLKGDGDKHLDTMQRKSYNLLKILSDMFNFRLKVVISDSWGIRQANNWTGVMGHLVNGRVDISLSPLRFTQQRVLATRYLPEVHIETIRFLFRHPQLSPISNTFLQPFTTSVWYGVLAFIVVFVILMTITMHYEYGYHDRKASGTEDKLDFFTLIILEAMFLQGPSQMFQFASTRTLIISICVFAVMLYQYYSAFIVGSLLADVPRTIVNMPALFNSSLDIGMEDIAYNYEFFINTSNQMAKDIYVHRIMRNRRKNILPLDKGLRRIERGGYAFHVAVVRAYHTLKERLTETEFCDLQEVAMEKPFASCPAVPHGSPYKDHFASAILQLRETGVMAYHDKLWNLERPDCSQMTLEKDITINMEHFVPALAVLAVAMLVSWIIFLVEFMVRSLGAVKLYKGQRQPKCLRQF